MNTTRKSLSILGVAAVAMFGLSACSGGADSEAMSSDAPMSSDMASESPMSSDMASESPMSSDMADPAANLIGPGCADYAAQVPDGEGSVAGMAMDPVATAASNNPILTTLTAAVSGEVNPDVNLVDTLNSGEFTVFAPTDKAFEKIDAATMEKLGTDADLLSGILTYHVIEGQLSPDEIVGTHTTVNGEEVTVKGEGDMITVGSSDAALVCGGVQTANATVYMIDSVLMPPAAK